MLPVPQQEPPEFAVPEPSVTSFHVSAQESSLSAESIATQLCIVAASSCFVRKSASISLVGFYSQPQNALQAKQLRCRTHQPIQHQRTTRNTLPRSGTACMVCITPGFDSCKTFLSLQQPNQPRKHSEKTSQSLQSHFIQVRRLLHSACQITALDLYNRSVTGEMLRTHRVRTIPI